MAKHTIDIKNDELTEDQKMIYNAKIEFWRNVLIEWWPWTWKTTLLFLIARKIREENCDFKIITNQNNLKNFLKDSFGDLDRHVMNAWWRNDSPWLMFTNIVKKLDPAFHVGDFFDNKDRRDGLMSCWLEKAKNCSWEKRKAVILVDEAQDLPLKYFEILHALYSTIYVFWDRNQQINEWGSDMKDIARALDIKAINQLKLNINFRNSIQIYGFAKLTWIDDRNLEVKFNSWKVEIIAWDYDEIAEIENILLDNIGNNIAIITNKNDQNKFRAIRNIQIVQSNTEYIKLGSYDNFCLNWSNNKWLEFDIVILTWFTEKQFFKKEMYVSITRAWYNKTNNTWWKLYVLDNGIRNYLDLENDQNCNLCIRKKEEISLEDIPF